MTASIERDGGVVELIRLKPIKMSVAGADVAFGIRFEIYATVDDVPIGMLGYDLNALVGQTELNVGSSRYNGPFPNLQQSKALLSRPSRGPHTDLIVGRTRTACTCDDAILQGPMLLMWRQRCYASA